MLWLLFALLHFAKECTMIGRSRLCRMFIWQCTIISRFIYRERWNVLDVFFGNIKKHQLSYKVLDTLISKKIMPSMTRLSKFFLHVIKIHPSFQQATWHSTLISRKIMPSITRLSKVFEHVIKIHPSSKQLDIPLVICEI